MRLVRALLFLQVASTVACGQRSSILGETRDCFAGEVIHPAKVDIYLLDPQESPVIVSILNDMEKQIPNGNNGNPEAFFASYKRLMRVIQKTRAVARARSDEAGKFSFNTLKEQKKFVLVGFAEREDEPAFYASTPLNVRPGKNSVTLDFFRGNACK